MSKYTYNAFQRRSQARKEGNRYILVYHGKHGDMYFDATTDAAETSSWDKLFNILDDNCYYDSIDESLKDPKLFNTPEEERLLSARKGNIIAIMELLYNRADYEYEGFNFELLY